MNYVVDIIVILLVASFAGKGAARGLVMTVGKLVTLVGGFACAHLCARQLKSVISSRLILPWVSGRITSAAESSYNPVDDILEGVSSMGFGVEEQLMDLLESVGLPRFSLHSGWGTLIDRLTGTGTNILETASEVVSERIAYVLVFCILFLGIQLVALTVFSNIDGLKNLPLVGTVNRLGGAAAGFLTGCAAVWGIMLMIMLFIPAMTENGGPLSPQVLDHTWAAKWIYNLASGFLQN